MKSVEAKENLQKLSIETLEELHERQKKIFNNKKLIAHLPDKGKQIADHLEAIKRELELRQNLDKLEESMKNFSINNEHVQTHDERLFSAEKEPQVERYKPSSSGSKSNVKEKKTQLIPLKESRNLLVDQMNSLPLEVIVKKVEGVVKPEEAEEVEAPI